MTKLERKLKVAIKALEFYSKLPKHIEHDRDEIRVYDCECCVFDCNREAVAKTALSDIKNMS